MFDKNKKDTLFKRLGIKESEFNKSSTLLFIDEERQGDKTIIKRARLLTRKFLVVLKTKDLMEGAAKCQDKIETKKRELEAAKQELKEYEQDLTALQELAKQQDKKFGKTVTPPTEGQPVTTGKRTLYSQAPAPPQGNQKGNQNNQRKN